MCSDLYWGGEEEKISKGEEGEKKKKKKKKKEEPAVVCTCRKWEASLPGRRLFRHIGKPLQPQRQQCTALSPCAVSHSANTQSLLGMAAGAEARERTSRSATAAQSVPVILFVRAVNHLKGIY
eukprot:TRINITY_DN9286_c0_g1_i1.p2 TRINITY_DN9286_c0_g1~~TRINITY_DN9286_c0_g1_i1.p2  ORF type:complete len:123 (+),score=14.38 TRINITY_DN9286_c0_g1_i1:408-776(+)